MSGLSPSTLAAYESRIINLTGTVQRDVYTERAQAAGGYENAEDYDFSEYDADIVLKVLKTNKRFANPETAKGYVSALLWKVSDKTSTAWDKYHEYFNTLKDQCNQKAKQQQLPEGRKEKYLTKDQLVKAYQKCYAQFLATNLDYYDHLVLALYIIQAPVRADYCGMRIVSKSDTTAELDKEQNYCLLAPPEQSQYGSHFLFRKYKTSKTYGAVSIPIEPDLEVILREHFFVRKNRDVLPDFWTPNTLSQKVRHLTLQYSGRACSIGLIRHAWVCDLYKTNPTILQKEDLAKRMLHSVAVQELYRTDEDMEILNQDE
jgi:hypothetical protein